MTTDLVTLVRRRIISGAIIGRLFCAGENIGDTLEPSAKAIPAGLYNLKLTGSGRALREELWTPWNGSMLPEVQGVRGRTGIRIHAGNAPTDSTGCILVGVHHPDMGAYLVESRKVLTTLKDRWHDPFRSMTLSILECIEST